jgi:hypothetical protein
MNLDGQMAPEHLPPLLVSLVVAIGSCRLTRHADSANVRRMVVNTAVRRVDLSALSI